MILPLHKMGTASTVIGISAYQANVGAGIHTHSFENTVSVVVTSVASYGWT